MSDTILGYYTDNQCVTNNNLFSSDQIHAIVLQDKNGDIIKQDLSDDIQVEIDLLASNHYHLRSDGRVVSNNLPVDTFWHIGKSASSCSLISGSVSDIRAGNTLRYQDKTSLEECVRIETKGKAPVYVVDNHQLAYYAWSEAFAMDYISSRAELIHIDAHADNQKAPFLPVNNLSEATDYMLNYLGIANFIDPAIKNGIVGTFWFIYHNPADYYHLEKPSYQSHAMLFDFDSCGINPEEKPFAQKLEQLRWSSGNQSNALPYILDIDLDAFISPSYENENSKPTSEQMDEISEFIASLALNAGVVTLATSPSYADQELAFELAKRIAFKIIK